MNTIPNTPEKKKQDAYSDFMNMILAVYMKIAKRCMLEGCRYGYFPTDKLTDNCVWCDQPRALFGDFDKIISLREFIESKDSQK